MGGDASVVVYPDQGLDTWTKAYENLSRMTGFCRTHADNDNAGIDGLEQCEFPLLV